MKINESGRSMIEMLGVLAIIGVLSVGGIAGYSKAMSKYRTNKMIDQVSHIIANTRILYGAQQDYNNLSTTIIDKAKLFPQEMGAAASATNPFAGTVTMVTDNRFKANDHKAVLLTYNGIPEEACIDAATIDWGTGAGGGLVAFGVNQSVSSYLIGGTDTAACPSTGATAAKVVCAGKGVMPVANATSACSGENNTLYFKFF